MPTCDLIIENEVIAYLKGLDTQTRRELTNTFSYFVPSARFTPAFKLGRWNGRVNFFEVGGKTYVGLLEQILPIVMGKGYEINLTDKRPDYKIELPQIDENHFAHKVWPKGHPNEGEPIILRDYQVTIANALFADHQSIVQSATGSGKAQPLSSNIKVPNGWKTMGEINAGDLVISETGDPVRVIETYPQGIKDTYEIEFSDGRKTQCCGEHLWRVYNKYWGKYNNKEKDESRRWKVLSTENIIHRMNSTSDENYYYIQLPEPEKKDDIELPIDPYLLGILIGDGDLKYGRICFSSGDKEVVQYIENKVKSTNEKYYVKKIESRDYHYQICIEPSARKRLFESKKKVKGKYTNEYRTALSKLGLDGKGHLDKFIPEIYKNASPAQKMELLKGLCDSDGTCGQGTAEYSTTSKKLANDVVELSRSLGMIARREQRIPYYTYKNEKRAGKLSYRVFIRHSRPWELFALKRKQIDKYQYENSTRLRIKNIKKIGKEECKCIAVDSESKLYITDNYIVTHNTIVTAAAAQALEPYGRSILIVPSKQLVRQTADDFHLMDLDYGVYYGDEKVTDATHTICTWQSLESAYKDRNKRTDLADIIDGSVGLIVDEAHNSAAQTLRKLLTTSLNHIPIRWGITGTIPKEEHHKQSLVSGIGQILEDNTVRSSDLQEKGVLADLHIDVWQTVDNNMPRYSGYTDEHQWLCKNRDRLSFIGKKLNKIGKTGNTLILVDRIETGQKLLEEIPNGYFISGSMSVKKRREILDKMNTEDDVVVVATYGTTSTGINVPRIFNLVLFEAGKSFIRVIQTIGRGIRKAKDKDFVQVYDVCSTSKYSSKHLTERKSYYRENKFDFNIEKIDYE